MDSVPPRITRRLRRLRVATAILVAALTCAAVYGVGQLSFDDNFASIFRVSRAGPSPSTDSFGDDDNICLILLTGDDLLSSAGLETLRRLHNELSRTEGVVGVRSVHSARQRRRIGRYMPPLFPGPDAERQRLQEARSAAAEHPVVAGHLLTADQRTTLLIANLDSQAKRVADVTPIVQRIERIVQRTARRSSWEADVTGPPLLRIEMLNALLADQWKFNLLSPLISALVAWAVFRRAAAVLIVSAAALSGVGWSLGAMGLAGESLNIVNSLLPTLTLTIGLSSAVHLLSAIRHDLALGKDRFSSIGASVRRVGLGCLLATVTTVIGFGSLASADLDMIARFGLSCAGGVVLTFVAAITIVPLLASTSLGNHIAIPEASRDSRWSSTTAAKRLTEKYRHNEPLLQRLNNWWVDQLIRRRHVIAVTAVATTAGLVWASRRLEPDITVSEALPIESKARDSMRRADEAFGGEFPVYVAVRWQEQQSVKTSELLAALEDVHEILEQEELLGAPISLHNLVESLPGKSASKRISELRYVPADELARFVRPSQREAIVAAWAPDAGSLRSEPVFERVELQLNQLQKKHNKLSFELLGSTVDTARLGGQMIGDLVRSLFLAVPITVVVLGVAMRSWKLALISLPVNIFPLAATSTLLLLANVPVQIGTATVFSICFGVAVDDTIHFLMHWRRLRREGFDSHEAIRGALRHVGGALIATTVIVVVGSSVVLTSNIPSVRLFGAFFIHGLLWALAADLLFLPAMLAACFPPKPREQPRQLMNRRRATGMAADPVVAQPAAVTT